MLHGFSYRFTLQAARYHYCITARRYLYKHQCYIYDCIIIHDRIIEPWKLPPILRPIKTPTFTTNRPCLTHRKVTIGISRVFEDNKRAGKTATCIPTKKLVNFSIESQNIVHYRRRDTAYFEYLKLSGGSFICQPKNAYSNTSPSMGHVEYDPSSAYICN